MTKARHTAELYRDTNHQWRYRVKARNGEIVAASEGYATRWNAKRAALRNHPDVEVTP